MSQRNYLINTTTLSTTASGTTILSGNTQSATFVVALTLVRTGLLAGELSGGNWAVHYVVSAMTTPYEMRLKLQRRNSGGTVQSESGYTTVRSATGTYDDNLTWDSGTWATDDQLALVWEHRRPSGTGNKNATVDAGGASYIDGPVSSPSASISPSASVSPSSSASLSLSPSASISPSSSESPSVSPSSSPSPSSSESPSVSPSASQSPSSSQSPSISPSSSLSPSSSQSPSVSPSASLSPSSSESLSPSPSASTSPSASESPSVSPSASQSPSSSESPSTSPSASQSPSSSESPSLSPSASISPSSSESLSPSPSASLSPSASESVSASASESPSTSPSSSISPSAPPPPPEIVWLDPGGDAVQAVGYFNTQVLGSGSITFDTTQKFVGLGSWKFDSGDGSVGAVASVPGVLGATRRISFYWRYDSIPDLIETATRFVPAGTAYSGGGFIDPGALAGDDEQYETATPAKNAGQGSLFSSLNFESLGPGVGVLPVGAVIDSVKIIYERKYDTAGSIGISRVKYRINGEEGPDHDNTDQPLVDTVVTVDVTADRNWTWQDLMDGVFEVVAEARRGDTDTEHTQSWDYLKVEVEYHRAIGIMASRAPTGDGIGFSVAVNPKGSGVLLRFVDAVGNSYDGVTLLLPDTWYRISLAYDFTGEIDNLSIDLYVDGVGELSIVEASTNGLSASNVPNLHYGWLTSPGVDHLSWFDQIYIDDGDDLSDPGNILMTAKLPASVNDNDWNTTVGTGAVNERPLSVTNYKQHMEGTSRERQSYTLQTAAVGDVDISSESLVGYMGWAWAKGGELGPSVDLIVNGVDVDRSTETALAPKLLMHFVVSVSYPSNAAGIGMVSMEEFTHTFLYECGVIVAYEGPGREDLLDFQLLAQDSETNVSDDFQLEDQYTLRSQIGVSPGSVVTTTIYAANPDGSLQQQCVIESHGGNEIGHAVIAPSQELHVRVDVAGADAEVGLTRIPNAE